MGKKAKGSILVLISALAFGVTPVLGRMSYDGGSNPNMLTFFRGFLALPALLLILVARKTSLKLSKKEFVHMLVLCTFGSCLTTVTLYASYQYISVSMATALHFFYPAVVVTASSLLYKTGIRPIQLLALVLSTTGVLLFCDFTQRVAVTGIMLALFSAFAFAFLLIYQVRSGLCRMDGFKYCFYQALFVSVLMLVFNLMSGTFTLALTFKAYAYSAILSYLVSIVAFYCLQKGNHLVGPSQSAMLSMLEPASSILTGVLVLNEEFGFKNAAGSLLILAGVVLQVFRPAGNYSDPTEK